LLLIWATPVIAASDGLRPFVRLSGIYVLPADSDIESAGAILKGTGTVETDAALGVIGAIGMQWPSGFQLEIEVGYRSIDLKTIDGTATVGGIRLSGELPVLGEIKTATIMPNIRYVLPRSLGGHIHTSAVESVSQFTMARSATRPWVVRKDLMAR